jgi:hypothetical protein
MFKKFNNKVYCLNLSTINKNTKDSTKIQKNLIIPKEIPRGTAVVCLEDLYVIFPEYKK